MFGLSGEHLLVLFVVLLIFGPKRLPDLGHSIGRTLKNFKDAMGGAHTDQTIAPSAQIPPRAPTATEPAPRETAQPEKAEPKV